MDQLVLSHGLDALNALVQAWLAARSGAELALAGLAVFTAYVVFAMAGFGTGLVAAPVLAQVLPVAQVVPLLAGLDCVAALVGSRQPGAAADRRELGRLLPAMGIGIAVGTWLLLAAPARELALGLGIFAMFQGIRGLLQPRRSGPIESIWGPVYGAVGGVCGALFGSGGFLYAIYLGRRLEAPGAIRATQAVLIGASTLVRTLGFVLLGVFGAGGVWVPWLCLLPVMLLGLALGRTLAGRLPEREFRRLLHVLMVLSSLALLGRAG